MTVDDMMAAGCVFGRCFGEGGLDGLWVGRFEWRFLSGFLGGMEVCSGYEKHAHI